jgi:thiol-disulfide isomerase/thioredoxin
MNWVAGFTFWLGLFSGAARADDGFIGIRYEEQSEGLIVTRVVEGYPAAEAGLVAGDLVLSVDGHALKAAEHDVSISGPIGTEVSLEILSPLSDVPHQVSIKRVAKVPKAVARDGKHRAFLRFSGALRNGSASDVRAATNALIDAEYDGLEPVMAFRGMMRAAKRRPRKARAALGVLEKRDIQDIGILEVIGSAYVDLGRHDKAVQYLERARAAAPDDLQTRLGTRWRFDERLAEAMWEEGDRDGAIALTRSLATVRKLDTLLGRTGMADPTPSEHWTIELPEEDDFEVTLYDGSQWKLSEHRGKPVALVFWASWCGPCKKEMPALAELVNRRGDWPVEFLAISVDKDGHAAKAEALVKRWDLPFPATRSREIGSRFGITTLPSVRVLGPNFSLRMASRGYSKTSVNKLEATLEQLLPDPDSTAGKGLAFPLADVWTTGNARLRAVIPLTGVRQVSGMGSDLAIIVKDHGAVSAAVSDGAVADGLEIEESQASRGDEHVAWLGGPVSAGRWWVRARGVDGEERWFKTLPMEVQALAASGDQLWISGADRSLVFDADGTLLFGLDTGAKALAAAGDGGVWAVDGTKRTRLAPDGSVMLQDDAVGAQLIASDGSWVGRGFSQVIVGRFGAGGGQRVVARRTDGTIVGLGGEGQAVLRIEVHNRAECTIAASDLDGDGQDELLISSWGRGLATVELEMP